MKQIVTIQENKNGKIIAGCDKSQCEGCKGSFFCTSKKADFQILNPENIDLKPGDKAEINLEPKKTLFTVFMSLAFPLLMFLPGYFISALISGSEAIHFIGAIIGVAIGFAISAIYFRVTKKTYLPVVTEKKEDEE